MERKQAGGRLGGDAVLKRWTQHTYLQHITQLNQRAVAVVQRIQTKLLGRDPGFFHPDEPAGAGAGAASTAAEVGGGLSVEEQVDRLIRRATAVENLCQLFFGWCPWA